MPPVNKIASIAGYLTIQNIHTNYLPVDNLYIYYSLRKVS